MEERQTEIRQETEIGNGESVEQQTVRTSESVPGSVLAGRVVYYIGGTILTLLAIRFVLLLFGASQASSFVNFIYGLSGIFITPFNGIFTRPTYGTSTFDSATLVAMLVYAIVTVGIARLITIGDRNRDAV